MPPASSVAAKSLGHDDCGLGVLSWSLVMSWALPMRPWYCCCSQASMAAALPVNCVLLALLRASSHRCCCAVVSMPAAETEAAVAAAKLISWHEFEHSNAHAQRETSSAAATGVKPLGKLLYSSTAALHDCCCCCSSARKLHHFSSFGYCYDLPSDRPSSPGSSRSWASTDRETGCRSIMAW